MTWWAAGSIVGGSVISGLFGSKASSSAAKAQQQASQQSIAEQQREYDQTRNDFMPYRSTGYAALGRLNSLGHGNMSTFFASPDYQFRRSEGLRGIDNQFAARGGAASGNALRALTQYSSNLASGEYGNFFNRQMGLAGLGLGATTQTANAGENMANNTSNALMAGGDARASGIMGSANSWTNALNSGLNTGLLYNGGYFKKPVSSSYNPQTSYYTGGAQDVTM